jgi:hypothetical protein
LFPELTLGVAPHRQNRLLPIRVPPGSEGLGWPKKPYGFLFVVFRRLPRLFAFTYERAAKGYVGDKTPPGFGPVDASPQGR